MTILVEFSKINRTRVYDNFIKNQIILSRIKILLESLSLNIRSFLKFFGIDRLTLSINVLDYLLQGYSIILDTTALLSSFYKSRSITKSFLLL